MAIRGPVATGTETASRKPFVAELALLEASSARFLMFLTKARGSVIDVPSPDYKQQERRPRGQETTMGANAAAAATQLTVADSSLFSPGDLIVIPVRSVQCRVEEIVDATTINVDRSVGGSGALTSGDAVIRMSRIQNEGYTIPSSYVTDTTQVQNYIAMVSTPVEFTNYQQKDPSYLGKGGSNSNSSRVAEDEAAMAIEHLRELDRQLLLSRKAAVTDANTGKRLLMTQGLIPTIVTNVYDHSGGSAITETLYNRNVAEPAWRRNGVSNKVQYTSSKALTEMEGFARDKIYFNPGDLQTLGFQVGYYRTTRGELKIVFHPHLDVGYYDESAVVCDHTFVKLAKYQDTQYLKDQQDKKTKTLLNEWSTGCGLYMVYEEAHVFTRDWRTAA